MPQGLPSTIAIYIQLSDEPIGNQPVIKHTMQSRCAVLYQAKYKLDYSGILTPLFSCEYIIYLLEIQRQLAKLPASGFLHLLITQKNRMFVSGFISL